MTPDTDVAIIGAGPYGLSIAAHLSHNRVPFRIFGTPMHTWRTQMLRNSLLKSDGFATSLSDPSGAYTLKAHCAAAGLPYQDTIMPVALSTFTHYGLAFQQRCVPQLEQRDITGLETAPGGFTLRVADGETFSARRVVVATGIGRFQYLPPELAALPGERISHSAGHQTVERFAGREVVIVGAGASALDLAAELVRAGAGVRLVARRGSVKFHGMPHPRTLRDRIAAPMSGIGPGWRSRMCTDAPLLFHVMPERFRIEVVRRHLGPAAGWFTREAVEGKVEFLTGRKVTKAEAVDERARLWLARTDGTTESITADHVIAATGYRVDLARLAFLPVQLRSAIQLCDTSPALTSNFESSVPGMYFVGAASANSFGPVSRFVYGANFTARRISAHLRRN